MNTPNHPEGAGIVRPTVHEPENDGEDDPAQVAHPAREARDDAVGVRVHVRHEGEVGAVAGLEEDGHERHEAVERRQVVRVRLSDHDEQDAGQDAARVHPDLLEPEAVARHVVQEVGDDAAQGPGDEVEKPKHGGPVGGLGLAQGGEVLQIVRRQDGVDGELAAEGARVAEHHGPGLQGQNDGHDLLGRGLDDDFALRGLEHFVFGERCFVRGEMVRGAIALESPGGGFLLSFFFVLLGGVLCIIEGMVRAVRGIGPFGDSPGNSDDGAVVDAVCMQILLDVRVPLAPLADRRIRAKEQHGSTGEKEHDQRDNEGQSPGLVLRMAVGDEGIIHGGHDKVGDAAACVAPASRKGIGGTDNILVEETRGPDEAGHERTS